MRTVMACLGLVALTSRLIACTVECGGGQVRRGTDCYATCNGDGDCPSQQVCEDGLCHDGTRPGSSSSGGRDSSSGGAASSSASNASTSSATASSGSSAATSTTSSAGTSSSSAATSSSSASATSSSATGSSSTGATTTGSSSSSSASSSSGAPLTLVVTPAYPGAGTQWGAHVANDGPTPWEASGAACVVDLPAPHSACIHAGMMRTAAVATESCDGLTLRDELGVFRWECTVDRGEAVFRSTGFQPGRGLKDLVTGAGFLPNRVLLEGAREAESEPAQWWSNAVVDLGPSADAPETLADPDTIFVVSVPRETPVLHVRGSGSAVVVLPVASLRVADGAPECPTTTPGATPLPCAVTTDGVAFSWVEGDISGGLLGNAVRLMDTAFSRVHASVLHDGGRNGLQLAGESWGNLVDQVAVLRNGDDGVDADVPASFNTFEEILAAENTSSGLDLEDAGANVLRGITAVHNGAQGVWLRSTSHGNVVADLVVANNAATGIQVSGNDTVVTGVLLVNNGSNAMLLGGSHNVVVGFTAGLNLYTVKATGPDNVLLHGLIVQNSSNLVLESGGNTVAQLASSDATHAASVQDAPGNRFTGLLLVNIPCDVTGTASNPGLVDPTCTLSGTDGSRDYPPGVLSDAELVTPVSALASLVGPLGADEPANPSDVAGTASAPTDVDWVRFANRWRAWGAETSRGLWSSGPGVIRDWRIRAGANTIFNRSGNGRVDNGPFLPGQSCPPAVHGAQVLTDLDTPPRRFLANAAELLSDGQGNDNGLCESNEACLYRPHFGAYVGEGTLAQCTFQDGLAPGEMVGVTMWGFLQPGASDGP
ncbi:MAG: right-handed parallel beta-helix repeat-containing protein [Myxococcota bacterium]